MKYKNLGSLGRALRNGEVDRKDYIHQRRNLIDSITSRDCSRAADTPNPLKDTAPVPRRGAAQAAPDSSFPLIKYLFGAVIAVIAIVVAFIALK
ncbi:MAG: hypothetical protein ACU84Q_04820 [Gammaproteobacteria bacterium]